MGSGVAIVRVAALRAGAGVAAALMMLCASSAAALEAMDGNVQLHGFYEMQVRTVSAGFAETSELTQWYNVLNLEFEVDWAPDGWGVFDLVQTFARVETRYDCLYTGGCGMVGGADTYGNDARNMPKRLRGARQNTAHGAIDLPEIRDRDITFEDIIVDEVDASAWVAAGRNENDLSTLVAGSDGRADNGVEFLRRDAGGNLILDQNGNQILVPNGGTHRSSLSLDPKLASDGIPESRIVEIVDRFGGLVHDGRRLFGLGDAPGFSGLADQSGGDGFLGSAPCFDSSRPGECRPTIPNRQAHNLFNQPIFDSNGNPVLITAFSLKDDDPFPAVFGKFDGFRFSAIDGRGGAGAGNPTSVIGPWLPENSFFDQAALSDIGHPYDNSVRSGALFDVMLASGYNGTVMAPKNFFPPGIEFRHRDVVFDPNDPRGIAEIQINQKPFEKDLLLEFQFFDAGVFGFRDLWRIMANANSVERGLKDPGSPSRITQAKPFRSIPVTPADAPGVFGGPGVARGLYIPSAALRAENAKHGKLNKHPFNISEDNRAWNNGASQKDEFILKEAYVDLEMFDSRLWMRLGKQNIVWGKTELFRTTDQFNPQDLALAILPSLEESRIALWSARAVWSFYEVGPLEDVRIELAANLDDFESADLGACGEPYAPGPVCNATFGLFAHGVFGIGLAGVDKPPSPYRSFDGWEVGGRVEWRWDRFSFAVMDFYGYEDLPYLDLINSYERNVDFDTGRPRAAGRRGPCRTQPIAARQAAGPNSDFGSFKNSVGATVNVATPDADCLQAGPSQLQSFFAPPLFPLTNPTQQQIIDQNLQDAARAGFNFNTVHRRRPANHFLADREATDAGSLLLNANRRRILVEADGTTLVSNLIKDANGNLVPSNLIEDANGNIYDPSRPDLAGGQLEELELKDTNGNPILDGSGNPITGWRLVPGTGSYSPTNAIDFHSANQQFFAVVCATTIGISNLDPAACAASVFGSGKPIPPIGFNVAQLIGGILTGQKKGDLLDTVGELIGAAGGLQPAVRQKYSDLGVMRKLNRDDYDGESLFLLGPSKANGPLNSPVSGLAYLQDLETNAGCVDDTNFFLVGQPTRALDFLPGSSTGHTAGRTPTLVPCHSGGAGPMARDGSALGQHLTREQQALLGCGVFFGTQCDDSGIDLLNMEASTVVQSWPGFEGTRNPGGGVNFVPGNPGASLPTIWTMTNRKDNPTLTVSGMPMAMDGQDRQQPGTLFFVGGPVATFYDRASNSLKTLPGSRGTVLGSDGLVRLHPDYDPQVDGCAMSASDAATLTNFVVDPADTRLSAGCTNAQLLVHPLANFNTDGQFGRVRGQLEAGATQQIFRSEMAAVSHNFLMLLATVDSLFEEDYPFALCKPNQEDADLALPAHLARCQLGSDGLPVRVCSLATPQFCGTVRGIFALGGVQRNIVRAGGDGTFGRRTFLWHSGGEALLRFAKRNVLGFSMDFAEDITKSSVGIEMTWIRHVPRGNVNTFKGRSDTDDLNLTLSIDRPTFVNFLNANRTIFMNTQIFFQYRFNYESGNGPNGPLSILAIAFFQTGYFQDRLLPRVTFLYHVQSNSAAMLPSIAYRFDEVFSIEVGAQLFWGGTELSPVAISSLGPAGNQQGPNAYESAGPTGVGIVRDMDGLFMRLRYTF